MNIALTYKPGDGQIGATGAYSGHNRVQQVHGGREYFDLLEALIENASSDIHLQFYIFNDDQAGYRIAQALIKAAARGVAVYLLIDGYESRDVSPSFIRELRSADIRIERFEPLFRSKKFYIGRRLHHKIAVFDGIRALAGGINVADRYMGSEDEPAWLDMALYIDGPAAVSLYNTCREIWKGVTKDDLQPIPSRRPLAADLHIPGLHPTGGCSVRIRRNDWVKGKNQIWKSYFEMFNQASDSIVIMCSYFLPGWIFLKRMKKAIARGVNIKVILAGTSDVMLAKHAERYLYAWMLRNGIEIYEYKETVLHAKVAVRDHRWMTIGSYNVNNISAYASIELNADVRNQPFVSKVQDELLEISAEKCIRVTPENFRISQNIFKRFWQWGCYQVIKVTLYLATFYFKQEV